MITAMQILEGQYIPKGNNIKRSSEVVFVGEKPSDYFLKHPKERNFGNYNNPKSKTDMLLQEYVRKYLGQVYITDMVKTEGVSGSDFKSEWYKDSVHKKRLEKEFEKIKPKIIVAMGRKVERLLGQEFPKYNIIYVVHPSATRYPKNFAKWSPQFEEITKQIK